MKVILIDPPVFLLLQEKERVLRQETIDTSAQDRLQLFQENIETVSTAIQHMDETQAVINRELHQQMVA